jgi:acyl-CoA thioester hydrolase
MMNAPPSGAPAVAHLLPIRVYYEDTDFSGAVYHAAYLRFMERGRTEMLRAAGVAQSALFEAEGGIGFAVRRMAIDFLRPARMDDQLMIETRVRGVGGASLALEQRVLRGEETLVTAEVTVACVAGGRAARLPGALRAQLRRLHGA